MTSSGRNYDYDAGFQRPHRDSMRTGYVLVSEERESGSEYSGSTCCCESCGSSCCSSESSGEDDDAYLSDCSACWARRDALRRGRAGWSEGERGYADSGRRAEARDQDRHHHNHRHGQHRHGETRQRGQQNSGHTSRNDTSSTNINTNTNSYNITATPAYRSLTEHILASTRRLHQDEENLRHFRTWMRVLEDIQRPSHVTLSNSNAAPAPAPAAVAAARTGQGSSSATALGRASDASSRAIAGEEAAARQTRVYPRGARGYFMSGGRSISSNRRRRL
ncbi:uncharacterized protein TRIVIDRAFT_226843 [Trichoderma virens Gv29-8]|uniref:Uncharacterized protein n=1 Tax=Hypocrea virens (strain Gv29-8 / FGSC 10586) TaxID=413071 RepID=G9N7P2_HYPVG|nr:uncharacterized protein TRIVIDRAFT_226843 [Trichoderma virens Gv29-8]EHK17008.1 hypothetical protein TRIVIDRAFT_226843 [Trichoderma virens Gv29-8]UKZ55419.1 hypothetical protein TrVGV298_009242 [Trichoderma virens]